MSLTADVRLPTRFHALRVRQVPDEDELDSGGDVPSATQVPCSNKNCAPRTEQLEAMTEQRVGAQKSRQKAQSRLVRPHLRLATQSYS